MPCSGFYTDVRKSESKAIDMRGWKKMVQSYIKYLGNDVPPIKISEYFNSDPDKKGKNKYKKHIF